MEWNIHYCILHKFFDKSEEEDDENLVENKIKNIYYRLRVISIINFIFMPFILIFVIFYNIVNIFVI